MIQKLRAFLKDKSAATAIEYSIIGRRHCPSNYRHCLQYRPKAQLHILLRFNSAEIGHPMRHMLFFVAIVGILGAIDAVELKGENRAALWRTVQSQGQIFNSGIEQSLRRHLW